MSAKESDEIPLEVQGIKILSSEEDSGDDNFQGAPHNANSSPVVVVEDSEAAACPSLDTSLVDSKESNFRRRLSRILSDGLRRSSLVVEENTPKTPSGWALFSSVLASCLLGYEVRLQKSLTCPPTVYAQLSEEGPMKRIYDKLTASEDSILRRPIQPSLVVGTRAMLSSTAAYLCGGPASGGIAQQRIRFREVMEMTLDGAKLAIEWELPMETTIADETTADRAELREQKVRNGPIDRPVVIVIHGINNNANFGYIRSMMRVCTDKGWIAAGMNLRGCGGIPLATPRSYNGAYTGDIRCVVQRIAGRLQTGVPLFLVGNSLGASMVTKYLGEEGLSGTLPRCVAGGAALGVPGNIKSTNMSMLFSPLLALGTKKSLLMDWATMRHMNDDFTRSRIRRALTSVTLAQFDEALAPIVVRNDPIYPFAYRVGFKDALSFWNDASSYRLVRFIPVPVLQLVASDDFLVYESFKGKLAYSLANPNVMVVESKCGGHLGWQESRRDAGHHHNQASWADAATADFIEAVFESYDPEKTHLVDMDNYISRERDRNMSSKTMRSRL